ncbi:MAG: 4-hydroxythreonine-4-phosphate dehydrogenase PdxA [Deltaproteobacteria bacterium]|nr:4-hydroxythreonine-4-phosphate dehydrogenase PdxA [Deltaproteobacteria bacterium]
MKRPRVAISMGDPTGIGPEVTLRALHRGGARRVLTPILVGDLGVYADTAVRLGLTARFTAWQPGAPLPRVGLPVRVIAELSAKARRPGRPTAAGGRAAYAAILEAVRLVQGGAADAVATAPINKANLAAAGLAASGHTELLAELAGGVPVRMMMAGPTLRVVLVTTHLALAAVPRAIRTAAVLDTLRIADRALRQRFGLRRPRLAVAGLNPHAGEQGLFGDEERRAIAPAVAAARRAGIDARGPLAADSAFPLALQGKFDVVICMYHDQGLAPFKLLHFADGVNVTLGLPFVRTSPDHGTAHDIAGRGIADWRSMSAALQLAAQLSRRRATRMG